MNEYMCCSGEVAAYPDYFPEITQSGNSGLEVVESLQYTSIAPDCPGCGAIMSRSDTVCLYCGRERY